MSRISIPIIGKTLWSTGDVKLSVHIDLLLRDAAGQFASVRFRVDSATDVTTFPAYNAKKLGLRIPLNPTPGVKHQQTGLEIRSGLLYFQIAGMDQTLYGIPCLFLGDPDVPPAPSHAGAVPKNLLQPLALLDQLRFVMEKDLTGGLPHGELIVEKL